MALPTITIGPDSPMNDTEYSRLAHNTLSPQWHADTIPAHVVRDKLEIFSMSSEQLDRIKKALFYGKHLPYRTSVSGEQPETVDVLEMPHNLLHGLIGIMTESGELADAILAAYDTGETKLDRINVIEEIGDVLWYCAIALEAVGSNITEAKQANIAKLAKRFPDRFTADAAIVRNLQAERATLESNTKPVGNPGE